MVLVWTCWLFRPCQAGPGGNAVEAAESSQKYFVLYFHLKAKALWGQRVTRMQGHGWSPWMGTLTMDT